MTVSCRVLDEQRGDNHGEVCGLVCSGAQLCAGARQPHGGARARGVAGERADGRLGTLGKIARLGAEK